MSSLVNDKVISVISTDPKARRAMDIESLVPWFSGINPLFKNLTRDVMRDIIRNCKFKQVELDQVIIKQGEIGNSFYILLTGEVSIYIKDLGEEGQDTEISQETFDKKIDKKSVQFSSHQDEILNYESDSDDEYLESVGFLYNTLEFVALDRNPFGVLIKALGPGVSFGELALINTNCIRNASIIADCDCDLLVVDRDLYNRSLKRAQEQELKEKNDFVKNFPLFRRWWLKYKEAVAQSLKPVSFQFNNTIVNQGDEITSVYFIRKGAAKVSIDPLACQQQYSSLFEKPANPDELVVRKDKEIGKKQSETALLKKERQKNMLAAKSFDVSLVGKNDIIGDIEVILELGTYLQTVTCTTSYVKAYELELKNVERLLNNKKNPQMPKTQTAMLKIVESKLYLRFKSIQRKLNTEAFARITILNDLLEKISDLNQQDKERQFARQKHRENKNEAEEGEKSKFAIYLPERGPLIDAFGPGSLAYMNKKNREKRLRKLRKEQMASEGAPEGGGEGYPDEGESPSKTIPISNGSGNTKMENKLQELLRKTAKFAEVATDDEDGLEMESDSVYEELDRELNQLETRIKVWYGEIYDSYTPINTTLAPSSPGLKRAILEKKSRVRREISPILKRKGAQSAPLDDPFRRFGAQSARLGIESAPPDGRKSVAFATPPPATPASKKKGGRRRRTRYQYTAEEYKELKEKLKIAEKKRIGFEYRMTKAVKVGEIENHMNKKTVRPRSSAF